LGEAAWETEETTVMTVVGEDRVGDVDLATISWSTESVEKRVAGGGGIGTIKVPGITVLGWGGSKSGGGDRDRELVEKGKNVWEVEAVRSLEDELLTDNLTRWVGERGSDIALVFRGGGGDRQAFEMSNEWAGYHHLFSGEIFADSEVCGKLILGKFICFVHNGEHFRVETNSDIEMGDERVPLRRRFSELLRSDHHLVHRIDDCSYSNKRRQEGVRPSVFFDPVRGGGDKF
jgi:hypothetical protein